MKTTASHKLASLQHLRAIAALLVVFHHTFTNRMTEAYADIALIGAWGVDIFFIISGFIIWTTVQNRQFSITHFVPPVLFVFSRSIGLLLHFGLSVV